MFLVFEGIDGSGKSTQARRTTDWLSGQGLPVVACRDPGSTPLGEAIRQILLDTSRQVGSRAEMLLYMAARAQLVEEVIQPALESGKVVISDRFLLSNLVYQGDAGGLPVDAIREVGKTATAGMLPDLTLIFDLPLEELPNRLQRPLDRMEARQNPGYRAQLQAGFRREASLAPQRIVMIDAMGTEAEVFARVQGAVRARWPHLG